MKIIKTASGKNRIKVSHKEWLQIGRKAGWIKKKAGLSYEHNIENGLYEGNESYDDYENSSLTQSAEFYEPPEQVLDIALATVIGPYKDNNTLIESANKSIAELSNGRKVVIQGEYNTGKKIVIWRNGNVWQSLKPQYQSITELKEKLTGRGLDKRKIKLNVIGRLS